MSDRPAPFVKVGSKPYALTLLRVRVRDDDGHPVLLEVVHADDEAVHLREHDQLVIGYLDLPSLAAKKPCPGT